jgi:hypothetical protein
MARHKPSPDEVKAAADRAEGKRPEGKEKPGRPTAYRAEYATQAGKLCKLGATDADLAAFFEVSLRTIANWKSQHEEFLHALKLGKEEADARVERSLFHKAVGYEQEAVKIFMPAGAAEPVYAPYTERVAPDTTAAIFWLKNRRPDLWRDRSQIEHTGKDGGPIETVELTEAELRERLKERGLPTRIFDQ